MIFGQNILSRSWISLMCVLVRVYDILQPLEGLDRQKSIIKGHFIMRKLILKWQLEKLEGNQEEIDEINLQWVIIYLKIAYRRKVCIIHVVFVSRTRDFGLRCVPELYLKLVQSSQLAKSTFCQSKFTTCQSSKWLIDKEIIRQTLDV